MEMILDIIWEKRRVYIEWKQIICAVLLAFLIAGLYNYIRVQSDYGDEFVEKQTVPAKNLAGAGTFEDILLLPKENVKERKSESASEIAAKEPDYAVNYGYTEPKAKRRTKSAAPVKETGTETIDSTAEKKVDDYVKHITEVRPDVSEISDIAAVIGNPDIGAERKDTERKDTENSVEKEKSDVAADTSNITADTDAADTNVTDTNVTDTDAAGTDRADADTEDTEKSDTKPIILTERFPGFLTDEKGHIAGYTDASKFLKDHLVVFPFNAACTGIEKDALKGLEAEIYEIYIPANISYIADGAFDELVNLYYIEVSAGNARFYSEKGILYYRNGKVAVCPNRLKRVQGEK